MPERIRNTKKINAAGAARLRAARAEFSSRPSKDQLLASTDYVGPMSIEEYLSWRKSAGDAPLVGQLKAAITATPKSLYAIAQASDVPARVLQRFVNGQRGMTLETAGKLAAYLGLALLPVPTSKSPR